METAQSVVVIVPKVNASSRTKEFVVEIRKEGAAEQVT